MRRVTHHAFVTLFAYVNHFTFVRLCQRKVKLFRLTTKNHVWLVSLTLWVNILMTLIREQIKLFNLAHKTYRNIFCINWCPTTCDWNCWSYLRILGVFIKTAKNLENRFIIKCVNFLVSKLWWCVWRTANPKLQSSSRKDNNNNQFFQKIKTSNYSKWILKNIQHLCRHRNLKLYPIDVFQIFILGEKKKWTLALRKKNRSHRIYLHGTQR